jgi:hypothetical protein
MSDIAVQRLYNQQIEQTRLKTPEQVVSWLGAMQAQDYTGAKWSIGLRLRGSIEAAVEQAIADKSILRTWMVRGTLHFVTASDIHWMLALLAPRIIASCARRYAELELDQPTFSRSHTVLADALDGGTQQTRRELFAILEENGISTEGQRGIHILQHASLHGLMCQLGMRANNPTFIALDEPHPDANKFERDEALMELARRYFTSHGPATLQDFIWWSGLLTGDARIGLEAAKPHLMQVDIGGQTYWQSQVRPTLGDNAIKAYLLPGFDEYLVSYRDRSASLDAQYAQLIVPGGNGVFNSTVVIDGRVAGTWKRAVKKGASQITLSPFTTFSADEHQAIAEAAQCYGVFVGLPVVL